MKLVLTKDQWKWIGITAVGATIGWLVIEYIVRPTVKEKVEPAVKETFGSSEYGI